MTLALEGVSVARGGRTLLRDVRFRCADATPTQRHRRVRSPLYLLLRVAVVSVGVVGVCVDTADGGQWWQ